MVVSCGRSRGGDDDGSNKGRNAVSEVSGSGGMRVIIIAGMICVVMIETLFGQWKCYW